MKANFVPIDSEVLGGNVLAIEDFSADVDFHAFEARYVAEHRPVYVSCKIPLERVADTHILQRHGFELIECQIRSRLDLKTARDLSAYPYAFERVTTLEELAPVLEIAGSAFKHDRFTIDPKIDAGVSGRRYRRYVEHAFESSDQAVYRLRDPVGDRTVAFKTHRYLPDGNALLLLGGVHTDYQRLGLGVINSYAEMNELLARGVRTIVTHISAANYHVFNVEIGKLGFRVVTTFATFRKVYDRT